MKNILLLSIFFIMCMGKVYAAKMYMWTDENGEKHFSQTPPNNKPNQNYKEKNLKTLKPNNDSNKEDSKESVNNANDKNILRRGETGPLDKLVAKKNPDKLYLVATPNINILIKREEKKKGRKLTSREIEKLRSKAIAKAVTQNELKNYQ